MSGHAFLLGSVAALASGPVMEKFTGARRTFPAWLDGFLLVSVVGLVLLEVVPDAIESRSLLTPLLLAAGLALPTMAERALHVGEERTHLAVVMVAVVGMAIHAALDGSALRQSALDSSRLLGYGVLLHQLPVSMLVWWSLRDRSRWFAWGALALMAVMTVVGYLAEPAVLDAMPHGGAHWLEAIIGGSLLHVVIHGNHDHGTPGQAHQHVHRHVEHHAHTHHGRDAHGHDHHHHDHHHHDHGQHDHPHAGAVVLESRERDRRSGTIGAAAAVALLSVLFFSRDLHGREALHAFVSQFISLAYDSAPALLLAYLGAGAASVWMPASSMGWLNRGSRLRQGLAGMAVGLPLPVCSCGVVPLYRQLVQQGGSTTAAIAFLVATPELGLDAILVSIPLLGAPAAGIRVAAAAIAAIVVALIMGARVTARRELALAPTAAPALPTIGGRARTALRVGLINMVDHTAAWILVGLLVAAAAAPVLSGSWLTTLPPVVDVMVFAAIGLPLYVCASASTPIVAALVAAGVSPGAGLALLLTGPATNVSTLGILSKMHGRPFAWGFGASMMGIAVLLGCLVNLLFPTLAATQPTLAAEAVGTPWQVLSALLVGMLFVASIWRRGVRAFFGELSLSGHSH